MAPQRGWMKESYADSGLALAYGGTVVRYLAFAIAQAAFLTLFTPGSVPAQAQFGSEKEARAMLERAVAAMKQDKGKPRDVQQGRGWLQGP